MSKQSWNDFVDSHQRGKCVFASHFPKVTSRHLDKAGKKLPTAYALLATLLDSNLRDDWAIRKTGRIAHILIDSDRDLAWLQGAFRLGPYAARPPVPCTVAYQFVFGDAEYLRAARAFGYRL